MTNRKHPISARIKSLSGKKLAPSLRPLMPDIQERLSSGVTYAQLVEFLQSEGINVSSSYLRALVTKYRKTQEGNRQKSADPANKPTVAPSVGKAKDQPAIQSPVLKDKSPSAFREQRQKLKIDLKGFEDEADEEEQK